MVISTLWYRLSGPCEAGMRVARFLMVAIVGLLLLVPSTGELRADIDGDGLDEIGAFAVEVSGASRGNWYQVWDSNAASVASQFLLSAFSNFQFLNADLNNNGQDELVIFAVRNSDGAGLLQFRGAGGGILASKFVTGSPFGQHHIFSLDNNGDGRREVGLGFARNSDGVAFYQVWAMAGANIVQVASRALTGGTFAGHQWGAGDFDNDGNDEVFTGFTRLSDGAGAYKVWDPQTDTLVGSSFVTGGGFSDFQWIVQNFAGSGADEVMAGYRRDSDGAAAYKVLSAAGVVVGSSFVTGGAYGNHAWRAVQIPSASLYRVFVGFTRTSDGVSGYQAWTVATGTKAASGFILGGGNTVANWMTGDFDGNPTTGGEFAVGYIQNSSGSIGLQTRRLNATVLSSQFVLGGSFVNPQFVVLRPFLTGRDDVLVGAQKVGGSPLFRVYRFDGTQLVSKFIFNNDVV